MMRTKYYPNNCKFDEQVWGRQLERKVWISPAGGANRLSYHQYLPEVLLCAYAVVVVVVVVVVVAEGHQLLSVVYVVNLAVVTLCMQKNCKYYHICRLYAYICEKVTYAA